MGKQAQDAGLITAKKLALELKVSMDELISDEAAQDIQINYGTGN